MERFNGQSLGQPVTIEIDDDGKVTDILVLDTNVSYGFHPQMLVASQAENEDLIKAVLDENAEDARDADAHFNGLFRKERYI